jgi:hypothetical protein
MVKGPTEHILCTIGWDADVMIADLRAIAITGSTRLE